MKINVAMLTHNEVHETQRILKQLAECEGRGRGIVQVLDDFSDADFAAHLKSLCEQYGFRFSQRHLDQNFGREGKRDFDFSAQRNACFELMPKDEWVAVIDADEEIIPQSSFFENVNEQIAGDPTCDSFSIKRRNVRIFGGSSDERFESQPRFFVNNGRIRYRNKIHECAWGCERGGYIHGCLIDHVKHQTRCALQHDFYNREFYSKGVGVT